MRRRQEAGGSETARIIVVTMLCAMDSHMPCEPFDRGSRCSTVGGWMDTSRSIITKYSGSYSYKLATRFPLFSFSACKICTGRGGCAQ